MPSFHLILCCPLLLLPPIPPSIRVFSNESTLCMRWSKYWSFSFSISPSNEHSGLISFRMDWLDLLEVQGTLKSLLQHHSSKASILWCSAFFMGQLSHPYMTTRKTMSLTIHFINLFTPFPHRYPCLRISLSFLMRRVDSLEKTLMLGGVGGRRRRGRQRMRWLDGITDSVEVSLNSGSW